MTEDALTYGTGHFTRIPEGYRKGTGRAPEGKQISVKVPSLTSETLVKGPSLRGPR